MSNYMQLDLFDPSPTPFINEGGGAGGVPPKSARHSKFPGGIKSAWRALKNKLQSSQRPASGLTTTCPHCHTAIPVPYTAGIAHCPGCKTTIGYFVTPKVRREWWRRIL